MKDTASFWPLLLLMVAFSYFFSYAPSFEQPQEVSHLYLARAMVEQGSFRISEQIKAHGDGASKVVFEGETFSDQAPGLAIISLPALLFAKGWAGARGLPLETGSALHWMRFSMAQIPAVIFFIAMFLFLVSHDTKPKAARAGVIMAALSVPLFLSSTLYGSTQLGALLMSGALLTLAAGEEWPGPGRFAAAGILAGAAVAIDYAMLPPLVILAFYVLSRARQPRWILPFFMAVGVWLALLGLYHFACFGSPFTIAPQIARGGLWASWHPAGARLIHALFSPAFGLVGLAPLWLLVPFGVFMMISRGEVAELLLVGTMAGLELLMACGERGMDTDPLLAMRLLAPATVFLIWPLVRAVELFSAIALGPLVFGVLGAASLFTTILVAPYFQFFPADGFNGLRDVSLVLLRDGVVPRNLGAWLALHGEMSVAPFAILILIFVSIVALAGEGSGFRRMLSVWLFAGAFLMWRTSWRASEKPLVRYQQAMAIETALSPSGETENVFSRQRGDSKLARGHDATSRGDNAAAIDAYRTIVKVR